MEEELRVSNQEEEQAERVRSGSPREAWYGTVLASLLLLGVLGLGAAAAWFGYAQWYRPAKQVKQSITRLSEATLPTAPSVIPDETEMDGASKTAEDVAKEEAAAKNAKEASFAVLNGGGPKGVAGEVGELLKKEGYQKVTVGNTKKDYTGVTLYFAPEQEAGAAEAKKILLKRYPKVATQGALAEDKETSGTTFVLILGKE